MGKYNKEKYYYFQLKSTFFDNDRTGRNLSTIMISLSN